MTRSSSLSTYKNSPKQKCYWGAGKGGVLSELARVSQGLLLWPGFYNLSPHSPLPVGPYLTLQYQGFSLLFKEHTCQTQLILLRYDSPICKVKACKVPEQWTAMEQHSTESSKKVAGWVQGKQAKAVRELESRFLKPSTMSVEAVISKKKRSNSGHVRSLALAQRHNTGSIRILSGNERSTESRWKPEKL